MTTSQKSSLVEQGLVLLSSRDESSDQQLFSIHIGLSDCVWFANGDPISHGLRLPHVGIANRLTIRLRGS
jgi:hypothetical protein